MSEVSSVIQQATAGMEKALSHLDAELSKIRAGRPGPHLVENIMVDYYGTPSSVTAVASCSATDAKTLTIQPWEKQMLGPIEKAILQANIGFTPMNDGLTIRLILPPMTEERRKEMVKQSKGLLESSKVGLRAARQDALNTIKKLQKDGLSEDEAKTAETKIQDLITAYTTKSEKLVEAKEKVILAI